MNRLAYLLLCLALLPSPCAGQPGEILDILVYGATGKVGRHIVDEALARGHRVTAVSRDPSAIDRERGNLDVVQGDILETASVAALVADRDIVVVSVRGVAGDRPEDAVAYLGANNVVEAMRQGESHATRLIHVGGAGSLEVEPGILLEEKLPKLFMPKSLELEIAGQVLALAYLRGVDDVAWTYITPPRYFTRGRRTGVYRIGGDQVMGNKNGQSRISRADFAVALVDEAENAEFVGRRFSVAY